MKKRILYVMACLIVSLVFVSCNKENVDPENPEKPENPDTPTPPPANVIQDAVTDVDGNVYDAVKLGNQVWMAENLRTTKYADGTEIKHNTYTSTTVALWYYPDNNSSNKDVYGLLYNWKAAMRNDSISSYENPSGIQGICPDNWHLPSDREWEELINYMKRETDTGKYKGNTVAQALASTIGWESSETVTEGTPGFALSSNNASGFSAVPAGQCQGVKSSFLGVYAFFWSTTEEGILVSYHTEIRYDETTMNRCIQNKGYGFSVRCLRD